MSLLTKNLNLCVLRTIPDILKILTFIAPSIWDIYGDLISTFITSNTGSDDNAKWAE